MNFLDNLEEIQKIDQENLAELTKRLPEQFQTVWQEKNKIKIFPTYKKIKNIVICGMGCDRIAGEIIKKTIEESSSLPVEVLGQYQTLNYIDEKTLVIVLSYSGNTPEIIFLIKKLLKLKKRPGFFAVLGGGQLERIGQKEKIPFYKFFGKGPSRANLGYLISASLIVLEKAGIIEKINFLSLIKRITIINQYFFPEKNTKKNRAKHLAYQIFDRLPIIVGAEHLWPIAMRWKKEINENAKTFAFAEESPEFFHNTVVGIEHPQRLKDESFFIFLESNFYQEKIKKASSVFKKILTREKISFETIQSSGRNRLEESITELILADWVSFYLAMLNQVDPTPVKNIEIIKKELKN